MKKGIGEAPGHAWPSCKGFLDSGSACKHAEQLSLSKKDHRYIIHTGDIFFVTDTCDIQPYKQLLFIYNRGAQVQKEPDTRRYMKGEQHYNNKYKTAFSEMQLE